MFALYSYSGDKSLTEGNLLILSQTVHAPLNTFCTFFDVCMPQSEIYASYDHAWIYTIFYTTPPPTKLCPRSHAFKTRQERRQKEKDSHIFVQKLQPL